MTGLTVDGTAVDIVYLDFSKAFVTFLVRSCGRADSKVGGRMAEQPGPEGRDQWCKT